MSLDAREASIAAQNAANVAAALCAPLMADASPEAVEGVLDLFDTVRAQVLAGTIAAIAEHGTGAPAKQASNVRKFQPKKAAAKSGGSDVPLLEACEVCGGDLWDNREDKKTPKSPDFRCRNRDECGAAHWWRNGEWQTG